MDVLFLCGAAVIGAMRRYWSAVAAALVQLAAVAMFVFGKLGDRQGVLLLAACTYLLGIGLGWAFYVAGRKLAKSHPRREVCELLGGSAFLGTAGLAIGLLTKIFSNVR